MKRILFVVFLAICCFLQPCLGLDWKPVPPEDLSLKTPRVDPAADAEALFWEMWVADAAANNQYPYTIYTHYIRIKIFNDRGAKKFGTVDIEYHGKQYVSDVAARTIEPDGSIQEVSKDTLFDRVVEKRSGLKVHVRSFAMPGVKAGSIIEYHWKESHNEELADYVRLPGHLDIPIEHLVYHLKPLENPYFPYTMRYLPFNMKLPPFKNEPGGYAVSSVDNIPAFVDERDAPPETQISAWALIYYDEDRKETPEKFWKSEGKRLYNQYKPFVKINGDVKALASKIVAGSTDPEDQLRRLDEYCRNTVKDISGKNVTEAERQAAKENRNTADTLKRGIGTQRDIALAFAALAMGAGFDARVAFLADRGSLFFSKDLLNSYFLRGMDIAVSVNGHWRLYDPVSRYVEPGHLVWQEEAGDALITDSKNPEWVSVPANDPLSAQFKRTGQLKLDEQGTLDGNISETLTGHVAENWRWMNQDHSPQEREKNFKDDLERRLPGAEVSSVELSDPNDVLHPVKLSCHVKVPNFATRTGKRLFFSPAFFEVNVAARYTASTRHYDVTWQYPWSEVEDVSIAFPPGYALDHADAPGGLTFDPVGSYKVKILKVGDSRILYHRELTVGKGGVLGVPQSAYANLKRVFDIVHDGDTHMLTLKVQPAVAASAK